MMHKIYLLLLTAFISQNLFSQKTSIYAEANRHYKEGLRLFAEGVYEAANKEFEAFTNDHRLSNEPEYKTLLRYAEYYTAISTLRTKQENADLLVTEFIKKYRPDPIAEKANLEVANYHFDQKNYTDAIIYYNLMDTRGMGDVTLSEVKFKLGYSYFAKKDFKNATTAFQQVKNIKSEWYYPTNYYLGMCHYFNGKYTDAIAGFEIAGKSKKYADLIPYYISHIYFSQGNYDKLISYTKPILNGTQKVDKEILIRRMVGHAYFLLKDYPQALEYLDAYEKANQPLEESDYYALGYSNYIQKKYEKAIPYFTAISGQQTQVGQNSNYYLADCYLRTGNTLSARTAFYNVSKLPYQENIREEALFNYAKLSAELGFDREAVTALNSFNENSRYYTEAQNIMGDVFNRTKDYDNAMRIIDGIKNPSLRLKQSYQKIAYYRSLQLVNEERYGDARTLLLKALDPSYDKNITISSMYWMAEMAHRQGDYDQSIDWNQKFIAAANSKSYPEQSLIPQAYYLQGYNYLKGESYAQAGEQFKQVISKLNKAISQQEISLLADSYLRTGDCLFKQNKYDDAFLNYGKVISNKYTGNDYAQYQSAIIQGLKGNSKEKIRLLDDLIKRQPKSKYADEALFELADTYANMDQQTQAVAALNRIVKEYAQSNIYNRALIRLGLITYNQGNKAEALKNYKEVFNHNPTPAESQDALTALQEIYIDDMGQPDEYIKFLETVPGYKVTNYSRDSLNYSVAKRYYEDGQYEKAITSFSEYLQKFPKGVFFLEAYYKRGESNTLLKKYDAALSDYEAVIQKGRSENYEKALFKAATLAYNYQQDFDKSYKYYAELTTSNIDENTLFEAQLGAMRSAYRKGLTNEVATYGEKVYRSPKVNNEQKATSGFYLGKIAYDQGNYSKANEYLKTVMDLSDNEQTAEARYLLANILFLQKNITAAEPATRSAITQNSDHPYWVAKCLILLSDIYVEKKDLFNARAALEAVLENYKEDATITKTAQTKLDIVKAKQAAGNKLTPNTSTNSFFENN